MTSFPRRCGDARPLSTPVAMAAGGRVGRALLAHVLRPCARCGAASSRLLRRASPGDGYACGRVAARATPGAPIERLIDPRGRDRRSVAWTRRLDARPWGDRDLGVATGPPDSRHAPLGLHRRASRRVLRGRLRLLRSLRQPVPIEIARRPSRADARVAGPAMTERPRGGHGAWLSLIERTSSARAGRRIAGVAGAILGVRRAVAADRARRRAPRHRPDPHRRGDDPRPRRPGRHRQCRHLRPALRGPHRLRPAAQRPAGARRVVGAARRRPPDRLPPPARTSRSPTARRSPATTSSGAGSGSSTRRRRRRSCR